MEHLRASHRRPRWPPSPWVENEIDSLSRELNGLSFLGPPPGVEGVICRGAINQLPVLSVVGSHMGHQYSSASEYTRPSSAGTISSTESLRPSTPQCVQNRTPSFDIKIDGEESLPAHNEEDGLYHHRLGHKAGRLYVPSHTEQRSQSQPRASNLEAHQPIPYSQQRSADLESRTSSSGTSSPKVGNYRPYLGPDQFAASLPSLVIPSSSSSLQQAPNMPGTPNRMYGQHRPLSQVRTDTYSSRHPNRGVAHSRSSDSSPQRRQEQPKSYLSPVHVSQSASAPSSPTQRTMKANISVDRAASSPSRGPSRQFDRPTLSPSSPVASSSRHSTTFLPDRTQPDSLKIPSRPIHHRSASFNTAPASPSPTQSPSSQPLSRPHLSRHLSDGPPGLRSQLSSFPTSFTPIRNSRLDSDSTALSLPLCYRSVPVAAQQGWFTISGLEHISICPSCIDALISSRFKDRFIPRNLQREQNVRCSFSEPWVRLAWVQTMKKNVGNLDMLYRISQLPSGYETCPGRTPSVQLWNRVIHPGSGEKIPNFAACSTCVHKIQILMPSLKNSFMPGSRKRERTCDLAVDSPRFIQYVDLLDAAANHVDRRGLPTPNFSNFETYVRRKHDLMDCDRDRPVDCEWHYIAELPELTICEDCYDDVVRPLAAADHSIARMVSRHPKPLPVGGRASAAGGLFPDGKASCQLYSPNMRARFREAVLKNDFPYLKSIFTRRLQVERQFRDRRQRLLHEQRKGHNREKELRQNAAEWKLWE